jgi:hypothetical protein
MVSSFGPPALTVGVESFRAGLAAHAPPHPFLAPLGHLVSADGPSGIVTGLAEPLAPVARSVEVRADEAPLPVRPPSSAPSRNGNGRGGVVQRWPARNGWGSPMVTASSVDVPPLAFDAVETPAAAADPALVSWDPAPATPTAGTTNGVHPTAGVAVPPVASRLAQSSGSPPPAGGGSTTPVASLPPSTNGHQVLADEPPVSAGDDGHAGRRPDPTAAGPPVVARTPEWAPEAPASAGPTVLRANSYLPRTESTTEPPAPVERRGGPVLFGPGSTADTDPLSLSLSPAAAPVVARTATGPMAARPLVGSGGHPVGSAGAAAPPVGDPVAPPRVGPALFDPSPPTVPAVPLVARSPATSPLVGDGPAAPATASLVGAGPVGASPAPTFGDEPPSTTPADEAAAESPALPVARSVPVEGPLARGGRTLTDDVTEIAGTIGSDQAGASQKRIPTGPAAGPIVARSTGPDSGAHVHPAPSGAPPAGPAPELPIARPAGPDTPAGPLTAPLVARAVASDEGGGPPIRLQDDQSAGPVLAPLVARSAEVTAPLIGSIGPELVTDPGRDDPQAGSGAEPLVARTVASEPGGELPAPGGDAVAAGWNEPWAGPAPLRAVSDLVESTGSGRTDSGSGPTTLPLVARTVGTGAGTGQGSPTAGPITTSLGAGLTGLEPAMVAPERHPTASEWHESAREGAFVAIARRPGPAADAPTAYRDGSLTGPVVGRAAVPQGDPTTAGPGGTPPLAGPMTGPVVSRSAAKFADGGMTGSQRRSPAGPTTGPVVGRLVAMDGDAGTASSPSRSPAGPVVSRSAALEADAGTAGSDGSAPPTQLVSVPQVVRPAAAGAELNMPLTSTFTAPVVARAAVPGAAATPFTASALGGSATSLDAPTVGSEGSLPIAAPTSAPVVARLATQPEAGAPDHVESRFTGPLDASGAEPGPDLATAGLQRAASAARTVEPTVAAPSPRLTGPSPEPLVVPTLGPDVGIGPAIPQKADGQVTTEPVVSRTVSLDLGASPFAPDTPPPAPTPFASPTTRQADPPGLAPGVLQATPVVARSLGLGLGTAAPARDADVQRGPGLDPTGSGSELVHRPIVGATALVPPPVGTGTEPAPTPTVSRTAATGAGHGDRALPIPVVARLAATGPRTDDGDRQSPSNTALVGGQPMEPAHSWPPRLGLGQPLAGDGLPPPATTARTPRPAPPNLVPMPVVQQASAAAPSSHSEPGSAGHAREVIAAALGAGGTAAGDGSIVFAPPESSNASVQRATVSDPPPQAATPPVTRAASAPSPSAEPGADDRASTDLDLLASQLYDRMLFRLRRDLRHELERKGQHVNLRRS